MVSGKHKGNSFERSLCKQLSLWITNNARDDILWRTAISGGRATVHAKRGKVMAHISGDICSVHPAGEYFISMFYVEAKTYKDLKVPQLLFAGGGLLADFWSDTIEKATAIEKEPMLIFKQNLYQPLVGLMAFGMDELDIPMEDGVAWFPKQQLSIITLHQLLRSKSIFNKRARPQLRRLNKPRSK